jgi:hypothetical protein
LFGLEVLSCEKVSDRARNESKMQDDGDKTQIASKLNKTRWKTEDGDACGMQNQNVLNILIRTIKTTRFPTASIA